MPGISMSPRRPPPAAAFALLGQLNDFLAFPAKERAAALEAFMDATEQREVALGKIEEQVTAAALDRVSAQSERAEAEQLAVETCKKADTRATDIINSATVQADAVTAQARKNSMASRDEIAEAKETAKDRLKGYDEREVKLREQEELLVVTFKDCEKALKAAKKEKKTYKDQIAEINALQRKAPK